MSSQCPICIENFNLSTKCPVVCPNSDCGFTACKQCTRTYILSITKDPCCMKCNHQFPSEFNVMELNRSFMEKDYRKHRRELLLERELSKLPETMGLAQQYKDIEKYEKENEVYKEKINELRRQLGELEGLKNLNFRKIWEIKNGKAKKNTTKFIMPCPDENCNGYLSTGYKCGICNLFTCPHCLEIIGESKTNTDHVCDEEKVKTAEFIKNTTKPCPGCGERIHKTEGCDQMWCTSCHTAFSWRTGIIDNGTIHNPHFYQFQRNNNGAAPRNPRDIHCGGLPNWWSFRRDIQRRLLSQPKSEIKDELDKCLEECSSLHRSVNHITHVNLVESRRKIQEYSNFQDLRVQYILKRITKEYMGKTLSRKDNLRRKYTELVHIYELLSVVGIDSFRFITQMSIDARKLNWKNDEACSYLVKNIKEKLHEYDKLRIYCNQQLDVISATFNQSVSKINDNFQVYSEKTRLLNVKSRMKKQKSASKVSVVENTIVGSANLKSEL